MIGDRRERRRGPLVIDHAWKSRRVPGRAPWGTMLAAAAIAAGLAAYLHLAQTAALDAVRRDPRLVMDAPPRPVAEVTSAVRAMKLVTVEIDTKVKVDRGDTSWRGDVLASVEVPVRLQYGTDLSKMRVDGVNFSSVLGAERPGGADLGVYVIEVPRPMRIATEIFGAQEAAEVQIGWLRLRSRAGEYYLGAARRDASDGARDLTLLPADAKRVERETLGQVEALVRALVGERAGVIVRFAGDRS